MKRQDVRKLFNIKQESNNHFRPIVYNHLVINTWSKDKIFLDLYFKTDSNDNVQFPVIFNHEGDAYRVYTSEDLVDFATNIKDLTKKDVEILFVFFVKQLKHKVPGPIRYHYDVHNELCNRYKNNPDILYIEEYSNVSGDINGTYTTYYITTELM